MRIHDHRLFDTNGTPVTQRLTTHTDGLLPAGKPDFIILHYTAGPTATSAINLFLSGSPRVSAHLVIDHDGTITQMLPLNSIGWHAGVSKWGEVESLNRCSVGIEIVNWGWLTGGPGHWKSWQDVPVPDERVFTPVGEDRGWELFDPAQIIATREAARVIMAAYDIPSDHVLGHEEISPSRKQDPGPAFDIAAFRKSL